MAHAALTEGVPYMLDTIPVPSTFARRRREALFLCALTCAKMRANGQGRGRVSIARRLDSDDRKQMVTLVTMC